MTAPTERDRVRHEVLDACAAHYCAKHAAFLAETLLDPIPDAEEEEFRRTGMADFYLRGGTLPVGTVLGLLADYLESLWGQNPVAVTLWERGYALYREWWVKRLAEHEAEVWRIQNGVECESGATRLRRAHLASHPAQQSLPPPPPYGIALRVRSSPPSRRQW